MRAASCGCSSVDRVLASEVKGRGFDPRQPHHFLKPKPRAVSLEPYLGRIGPHLLPCTSGTKMLPCRNQIFCQKWLYFWHAFDEKHVFETDATNCDFQNGTLMVPGGTDILPPNFFAGFYTQVSAQFRWSTLFSLDHFSTHTPSFALRFEPFNEPCHVIGSRGIADAGKEMVRHKHQPGKQIGLPLASLCGAQVGLFV